MPSDTAAYEYTMISFRQGNYNINYTAHPREGGVGWLWVQSAIYYIIAGRAFVVAMEVFIMETAVFWHCDNG